MSLSEISCIATIQSMILVGCVDQSANLWILNRDQYSFYAQDEICAVALTPTHAFVASDTLIQMFKIGSAVSTELIGHTDAVNEMQPSADYGFLYSISLDKSLRIWNISVLQPFVTSKITLDSIPTSMALLEPSRLALGLESNDIIVCNLDKPGLQTINTKTTSSKIIKVIVHESQIVTAHKDGTVRHISLNGQLLDSYTHPGVISMASYKGAVITIGIFILSRRRSNQNVA
jgi:WD40 repeat protein